MPTLSFPSMTTSSSGITYSVAALSLITLTLGGARSSTLALIAPLSTVLSSTFSDTSLFPSTAIATNDILDSIRYHHSVVSTAFQPMGCTSIYTLMGIGIDCSTSSLLYPQWHRMASTSFLRYTRPSCNLIEFNNGIGISIGTYDTRNRD